MMRLCMRYIEVGTALETLSGVTCVVNFTRTGTHSTPTWEELIQPEHIYVVTNESIILYQNMM